MCVCNKIYCIILLIQWSSGRATLEVTFLLLWNPLICHIWQFCIKCENSYEWFWFAENQPLFGQLVRKRCFYTCKSCHKLTWFFTHLNGNRWNLHLALSTQAINTLLRSTKMLPIQVIYVHILQWKCFSKKS